jgi:hypothetical protein
MLVVVFQIYFYDVSVPQQHFSVALNEPTCVAQTVIAMTPFSFTLDNTI